MPAKQNNAINAADKQTQAKQNLHKRYFYRFWNCALLLFLYKAASEQSDWVVSEYQSVYKCCLRDCKLEKILPLSRGPPRFFKEK